MLQLDEVRLTTLRDATPGRLVLVYGPSSPGMAALVLKGPEEGPDEGRPFLFALSPHFCPYPDDHRRKLYDLGPPTVRFDPSSFIGPNDLPPGGTLIDTGERRGIFEAGARQMAAGMLADLSGDYNSLYREHDQPAFTRWAMGIMRGDEFIPIVDVDAKPR